MWVPLETARDMPEILHSFRKFDLYLCAAFVTTIRQYLLPNNRFFGVWLEPDSQSPITPFIRSWREKREVSVPRVGNAMLRRIVQ